MKLQQGAVQASGHWILHLVDPEDLDLLRFEETGEMPEGMDFAVLWNGVWREGRCYPSSPNRTFVIYQDAQRLPLCPGMHACFYTYSAQSVSWNLLESMCKRWDTSSHSKAPSSAQTRPSLPGSARRWQSPWGTRDRLW